MSRLSAYPAHLLRYLLVSWPLTSVGDESGEGEDINGGDAVEWLYDLREMARAALSEDPSPTLDAELRRALADALGNEFACGEWDRNESDESYEDALLRSEASERYLRSLLGIPEDEPGTETVRSPRDKIRAALVHLKLARDLLREAGAPKATDKVRSALKSAQGAERHALAAPYRKERREARAHR